MNKILILASNARQDIKVDREIRDLKKELELAIKERRFEVEFEIAVRPKDLQELFRTHTPRYIHFCGHGAGEQGLIFQNDKGEEQLVSTEALSKLFELLGQNVKCALLNACNTDRQAEAFVKYIDYAIGMRHEIDDTAAYYFAVGFYQGLAYEESIERSYELGCNAIQINLSVCSREDRKLEPIAWREQNALPEHEKPILYKKSTLSSTSEATRLERAVHHPESSTQSNLPPGFEERIVQAVERKQYKDGARETWDQFGQVSRSDRPSLTQHQYRQRQILLGKVKNFWLEGFLKKSLNADAAINLDLKTRLDAVRRPFEEIEKLLEELDESFDQLQKTKISNELGHGKTLLLLGEPGGGKTIALLQQAQRLVERTERDLSLPISVVFNLSSWAQQELFVEWLIKELREKYQVPKLLGETWIKKQQLILLLDGLDEVKAEYRNDCVYALNQFVKEHPSTYIAVCSRVKDYEALTERLQLSSAICIQPISPKQVDQILENAGDSLAGLKSLLQQDDKLKQFTQTPLILNMMISTYQGWTAEELLQEFRSLEYRYQRLFEAYIERMLRQQGAFLYEKDKVLHWLTWLAKRMVQESQTVFLIEKMQPTWLHSQSERRTYRIRNFLLGALIIGLIIGLISGLMGGLTGGLMGGLNGLIYGLIYGLFFGLFFGLSGGLEVGLLKEITLFEQISWSCQKAKSRLIFGLIFGLMGGLFLGLFYGHIFYGLIYGLIVWLIVGLSNGVVSAELEHKTVPNQGILSSGKNFAILGLIYGLIGGVALALFGGLIYLQFLKQKYDLISVLTFGLSFVLCIGLNYGLRNGGAACIQHFNLRLILHRKGRIPWNYARFLDYASDRRLMKKVGGGYIFYHRMLMEHFDRKRNRLNY